MQISQRIVVRPTPAVERTETANSAVPARSPSATLAVAVDISETGGTMAYRPDRSLIVRHSLAALGACAVLLSGCNLGCWFAPCDGALDIGVVVKDQSGAPIPGVHVAVVGYSAETDSNGCVKIDGIVHPASIFRDPDVALSAERAGYKPLSQQRPFGVYRVDITLQPSDSSKSSSAVWSPTKTRASLACS